MKHDECEGIEEAHWRFRRRRRCSLSPLTPPGKAWVGLGSSCRIAHSESEAADSNGDAYDPILGANAIVESSVHDRSMLKSDWTKA